VDAERELGGSAKLVTKRHAVAKPEPAAGPLLRIESLSRATRIYRIVPDQAAGRSK
jgi:hypothetical protein